MRDNDGRKLDRHTQEAIRMRAVYQLEVEDARVEDVAAALGLDRSTVFGWQATYRAGGWEALRRGKCRGVQPSWMVTSAVDCRR